MSTENQAPESAVEETGPETQSANPANAEAARYRIRLRETEAELEKLREQVTQTSSELEAARATITDYETKAARAALVQEVTQEADLNDVQSRILKGDTKEELLEHAALLKDLGVGSEPERSYVVPTIGMTPDTTGNMTISQQIAAAEQAGDTLEASKLRAVMLGKKLSDAI